MPFNSCKYQISLASQCRQCCYETLHYFYVQGVISASIILTLIYMKKLSYLSLICNSYIKLMAITIAVEKPIFTRKRLSDFFLKIRCWSLKSLCWCACLLFVCDSHQVNRLQISYEQDMGTLRWKMFVAWKNSITKNENWNLTLIFLKPVKMQRLCPISYNSEQQTIIWEARIPMAVVNCYF